MKATGIIVEYNPLHNGHIYHLQQTRQLTNPDVVVAVMSGNFVQRGEPAIVDKWTRTRAAIEAGVDLVLELPFVFATQSASQFGKGAVDILSLAKCEAIVFGSETNNLEELKEIAQLPFQIDNFKQNMKKGYSYPASYGYMADSYGPNDILAISYLRALQAHPQITPYAIKRTSDYLDDDITVKYPSALAIRRAVKNNQDIKGLTPMDELLDVHYTTLADYYSIIRQILLTTPIEQLQQIFLMDEGIENLMVKQAYKYQDWDSFLNGCVTRRYTKSRIQRTLCQLLVHNTKQDMKNLPPYDKIRVLGFSTKGQQYLKELQAQSVAIANHFTANIKPYRDVEYKAAVVYGMLKDEKTKHYLERSEICGLNYKDE